MYASIFQSQQAWAQHPQEWLHMMDKLARQAGALQVHGFRRALGLEHEDYVKPAEGDARFDADEWREQLFYDLLKQWYLLYTRWIGEAVYDTPAMTKHNRRRAAFWVRQWFNALAPSNYFLTNPVAIRKFYETNGESILEGLQQPVRRPARGRGADGGRQQFFRRPQPCHHARVRGVPQRAG